jgi:Cys-rich protein (TIGR01571 family)
MDGWHNSALSLQQMPMVVASPFGFRVPNTARHIGASNKSRRTVTVLMLLGLQFTAVTDPAGPGLASAAYLATVSSKHYPNCLVYMNNPESYSALVHCGFVFTSHSLAGILTGVQRARIRATYGIEGSRTKDFALAIFCRPCTMVQMDREVRAREGDIKFRTNPKAPVIEDQPSRIQEMRYVSPRATNSGDSQNRTQSGRDCSGGACDGSDPLAGGAGPTKVPKQQPNPAKPKSSKPKLGNPKSGDPKSEKSTKSPQSEFVYVEISPLKDQLPSPLKPTKLKTAGANSYSFSRDAPLQRLNKEAQDGKKASSKSSDPASRSSHNENKKDVRSPSPSSTHGLPHFPPGVPSKEVRPKQGSELKKESDSTSDNKKKGETKEVHSQHHIVAIAKNRERETSKKTATGSDSVIVGSSKARDWKNDATSTTDAHELSYVHDFSDCPVDKNVLDYYEKEEQRSQASQQHTLEDCSRTSPRSAHYSKSLEQHALEDCPEKDPSKTMKSKSTSPQPHALANCPEKDTSSKTKSDGTQTHNLDDDPVEKGSKAKPALQAHALADCPEKDTTTKVESARSQRHTILDCPKKDTTKAKSAHSQPHALVDCEATENSKDVKSSGPLPHALADCALESVRNSPTEQHALAECHGDGSKQSRRASSNPDSHNDRHPQAKEHRLASCPASSPNLKDEKAITAHHVAENARINESGDRQSTMKPSSQHTLSDCMGGVKLERQTAAVDNQLRAERHTSLSSLRDFIKGKQDLADHPQKSRYRKEVDGPTNSSGTKRPSHAQQSLSQILGGGGSRKEKSPDDTVEAIKGAMHSVGDKLKKRSDSVGDAFKRQTDKIGGDVKKGTENIGGEIKKGTENVGDKVRKQTDKIGGKEEHKSSGSGFSNILNRMSPKSKAQQ